MVFIALLRGINVSGHRKVPMPKLKQLFEGLGCTNVATYIQSGNVVFEHAGKESSLLKEIQQQITNDFGFEVPVLVKTAAQLHKVLQQNDFINRVDVAKVHVTFLDMVPEKEFAEKLQKVSFLPDEFKLEGDVIYIYCPNGYGNTKLTNTLVEGKLKVTATTRNWKTVNKLVELAEAIS